MASIGWIQQANDLAAANGAPTLATDGVALSPHKRCVFKVEKTNTNGPYDVLLWFYRGDPGNEHWAPYFEPPYNTTMVGLNTSIQGDPPIRWPLRAYIQLPSITAGDTFDLWWGVVINEE